MTKSCTSLIREISHISLHILPSLQCFIHPKWCFFHQRYKDNQGFENPTPEGKAVGPQMRFLSFLHVVHFSRIPSMIYFFSNGRPPFETWERNWDQVFGDKHHSRETSDILWVKFYLQAAGFSSGKSTSCSTPTEIGAVGKSIQHPNFNPWMLVVTLGITLEHDNTQIWS